MLKNDSFTPKNNEGKVIQPLSIKNEIESLPILISDTGKISMIKIMDRSNIYRIGLMKFSIPNLFTKK